MLLTITRKRRSRARRKSPLAPLIVHGLFVSLLAAHCVAVARAQTPTNAAAPSSSPPSNSASVERERGVEMIKKGDFKGASKALRDAVRKSKEDADAWYYLGVALSRSEDDKEARKAFEQSLKLRPQFVHARVGLAYSLLQLNKLRDAGREIAKAIELNPRHTEAHYVSGMVALRLHNFDHALSEAEAALKHDDDYRPALLLKTQALIGLAAVSYIDEGEAGDPLPPADKRRELVEQASATLEKLARLEPDMPNLAHWREQLETLGLYTQIDDKRLQPARTIFSRREVTQKAVLLKKPEPGFTDRARYNQTSGTVRLRLVLGADGVVRHILVIRGLPDGLTERAIAAARKITFTPAIKDGQPVSTFVVIEYNFHIY